MKFIKTYEQHELELNANKTLTVAEHERSIGEFLMNKIPIFKSFKRSLAKANAEILGTDNLLRLFNNKPSFVYKNGQNGLSYTIIKYWIEKL